LRSLSPERQFHPRIASSFVGPLAAVRILGHSLRRICPSENRRVLQFCQLPLIPLMAVPSATGAVADGVRNGNSRVTVVN
jgi:hypothetical protein